MSLLDPEVSRDGNFDPDMWDIINEFNERGVGTYQTTYYLSTDGCSDSVVLSIDVIADAQEEPLWNLDAGLDNSLTISYNEALNIDSWDEVRKLYLSLLQVGVSTNGEFDPAIWDLINRFQSNPLGSFFTTYTITEGNCEDSVDLTVVVIADKQEEPLCNLNAGPVNSKTILVSEPAAIESWDEVRKLYLSLLSPGISTSGTFSPTI